MDDARVIIFTKCGNLYNGHSKNHLFTCPMYSMNRSTMSGIEDFGFCSLAGKFLMDEKLPNWCPLEKYNEHSK